MRSKASKQAINGPRLAALLLKTRDISFPSSLTEEKKIERERESEMAMGGSHHHNHKGNSNGGGRSSSSSSSGKPYGLMLLLAFGAAVLGVMVLHKLRERRIFSLLVKEKDSQLISLQLLLQKEREYGKEMKMKNQEMKAKLYSLRKQKMELDRVVLEMQSTIDSLKDEQRAIESALKEKHNEMKMLREQIDANEENSRVIDLKEAGIADLKNHLEYPAKASIDELTNSGVNLTYASNVAEKSDNSSSEEAPGELHDSAKFSAAENSTRVDDKSEKRLGDSNSREITTERLEKTEDSQDEDFKNGGGINRKANDGGEGEREKFGNSLEQIVEDQGTDSKPRENSNYVKDGMEHTITRENKLEKLQNSLEYDNHEVQASSKGGTKLEMQASRTRLRGRRGHLSRRKGKKWITLAKKRVSETDGAASIKSRKFYRLEQEGLRSGSDVQVSNEGIEQSIGKGSGENLQEFRKTGEAKDAEHRENEDENVDPNQQMQQKYKAWKKSKNSPDEEVLKDITANGAASNISTFAEKQFSNEVEDSEEEAAGIQQKLINDDNSEQENKQKQENEEVKHQLTDDIEDANVQESETEATNVEFTLDEDKAEFEETDETDF